MRTVCAVSEDLIRRSRLKVAGRSEDSDSPYERIYEDAAKMVRARLKKDLGRAVGDSPIEKLFITALSASIKYGDYRRSRIHMQREYVKHQDVNLPESLSGGVVVFPQAIIGKHRVDFLILTYRFGLDYSQRGWRGLVVECDGHDFHERTKAQAEKDKSRDREIAATGYHVFRFTGSELWRDPMKCAREVINWGLPE